MLAVEEVVREAVVVEVEVVVLVFVEPLVVEVAFAVVRDVDVEAVVDVEIVVNLLEIVVSFVIGKNGEGLIKDLDCESLGIFSS